LTIRFAEFELDTEQKAVIGPDGPVGLRPQTFAVLCHLIEKAPAVVSRDELLDAVWGHQATSVSSVAQTIKELRQALGDSSSEPRLIATRRRLGYQFICEVRGADGECLVPNSSVDQAFIRSAPRRSLVVLALVLVAALVTLVWQSVDRQSMLPGGERLPVLAVAEMVNAGDDPELNWLGPALESYLGHALVELGGFRVLSLERLSEDDESRLGDVDFLIEGRYLSAGVDGTRLLASLRRPGSEEIVTSVESALRDWDVALLSIETASAIRDRLGFSAPAQADPGALRSRLPQRPESQRIYFEALDAIAMHQPTRALQQINQARRQEPDHPRLDHLEAIAQRQRGDWAAAQAASERALSATTLWPRRDRLEIESTAALLAFDFERAADRLQALTQFYPDPEINRRLIDALIQAGRLQAASEALDSLRLQQPHDPRVALLAAALAAAQRDHANQLNAAQQAVELAKTEDLPALLPSALLAEAEAFIELGKLSEARQVLDDLLSWGDQLVDADLATTHLLIGRIDFQQGAFDQALAETELAESLFDLIPHPLGQAKAALQAGAIHDRAGRLQASLDALFRSTALFESLGDQRRQARALVQLGTTLMRANQPDEAIERFTEAARYFRAVGDRQGEGAALINHATLIARAGRLFDAEPLFERAREAFEDAADLRGKAMALGNLAAIAGDRRDMSRSIELAEEALDLFELLGADNDIARVSYNLALIHRRQGDLLSAELQIRRAGEAFERQGAVLMQTRALTTLGAILVNMGREEDVIDVLRALDALEIEDPAEQSMIHVVRAEQALQQDEIQTARDEFQRAYDLMAQIGAENHLLVSRLNLARVDLAEGLVVRAEQEAKSLLAAFEEIRMANRQVDSLLLLAATLIEQNRLQEAETALGRAETLLTESPDAKQALELGLLRSRIADPVLAQQRLEWVEVTAGEQGFAPLMARARSLQRGLTSP
jgi:DNA-binding winged helix-turn-helix (wHTH) protein/tetratricopeptide (TPR) repeat protein